jgi:hypothetical protein
MRVMIQRNLFSMPPSPGIMKRLSTVNDELATGVGSSILWKTINVDENYIDGQTSLDKFDQIENIVLSAKAGKGNDPQATLWHWAARCNNPWPISQFLQDPVACQSLMFLNSAGKTALELANEYGHRAVADLLQVYITQNNLLAAEGGNKLLHVDPMTTQQHSPEVIAALVAKSIIPIINDRFETTRQTAEHHHAEVIKGLDKKMNSLKGSVHQRIDDLDHRLMGNPDELVDENNIPPLDLHSRSKRI